MLPLVDFLVCHKPTVKPTVKEAERIHPKQQERQLPDGATHYVEEIYAHLCNQLSRVDSASTVAKIAVARVRHIDQ